MAKAHLYMVLGALWLPSALAPVAQGQPAPMPEPIPAVAVPACPVPGLSPAGRISEHFVLFHAQPGEGAELSRRLESAYARFAEAFAAAGYELNPAVGRLEWLVFDGADDFDAYGRQADRMDVSWTEAYYSQRTRRVAMVRARRARDASLVSLEGVHPIASPMDDPARIVHEAAHQLAFHFGVQARGVMYPLWVAEGLATNFEPCADPAGRFGQENPRRLAMLARVARAGRAVSLDELLTMARVPDCTPDRKAELYAQWWGLFQFLFATRGEQLRGYLGQLTQASPGRRSSDALRAEFEASFGPVERVQAAWQAHLVELREPAGRLASAGVSD